ncbi:MAG: GLUG motif-containing protein, partial [Sedimentisphaerales bacterium]
GGDNLGLFGWIGGSVKNLGLENFSVSGSSGSEHIGGLVGYNGGTISNCSSTGSVSGSSGSVYIGGLVGYNDGTISNCNSTGAVSGSWEKLGGLVGYNVGIISSCYSTGAVSGSSYYVGGLVGWNVGIISNCYATGTVSGYNALGGLVGENYNGNKNDNGSISNCYSTGTVSGFFDSAIVGGLVGNNSGSISHSYFLVTSGPDNGFGTPLTNAQMKQRVSLVGWDFNALWHICETTNYPKLIWQMLPADFVCPDGVNFADFGFFANWWGAENCAGANNCDGADFDFSGKVDEADLAIMCDYWLKGL